MKGRVQWLSSDWAKSVLGILICAGVFLLCNSTTIAQTFYGSIVGTVSDATGAVIPGSTVTLTNLGTISVVGIFIVSLTMIHTLIHRIHICTHGVSWTRTGSRTILRAGTKIISSS